MSFLGVEIAQENGKLVHQYIVNLPSFKLSYQSFRYGYTRLNLITSYCFLKSCSRKGHPYSVIHHYFKRMLNKLHYVDSS